MSTAINTSKIVGRRQLHFDSLEDIAADVEKLARSKNIQHLGNWSPGQITKHLATTMNCSIDGFPHVLPGFVRSLFRLFLKGRILNKPMSPGFKLPAKASALIPQPITWEEGLRSFREALARLKSETKRAPNPVLGPLTAEEWERLHCRHSELHLSFLVPS
jgi:hypothetical protein